MSMERADFPPAPISEALARIARKLAVLRSAVSTIRPTLPLNPCLSEADLAAFEQRYRVTLPLEYRAFLLSLGNGGTGLGFWLLPLKLDWGDSAPAFDQPFPVSTALPRELHEQAPDQRCLKEVANRPVPGCLEVAEEIFCEGTTALLVLNGEQRGMVWYQLGFGELEPCTNKRGHQVGFLDWYEELLNDWLQEIAEKRPSVVQ